MSLMYGLKFRSIGPKVQPTESKRTHTQMHRHTHTHMDATENINSSANEGGIKMDDFCADAGHVFLL